MKIFAVALFFDDPWFVGEHKLPEHLTMNILAAESWLDALQKAFTIHREKGQSRWHSVAEIEEREESQAPIEAIRAIMESHGPGTITPDWAYERLSDWLENV